MHVPTSDGKSGVAKTQPEGIYLGKLQPVSKKELEHKVCLWCMSYNYCSWWKGNSQDEVSKPVALSIVSLYLAGGIS